MSHLNKYLELISLQSASLKETVEQTAEAVRKLIFDNFDYRIHLTGLLLGNVQSGKTAQLLGVVSDLADRGFELFLILTTDNIYLHKQTLERVSQSLPAFNVYGEIEDIPFLTNKLAKPIVVVLKKNTNVLRKWRNLLSSSGYCSGRPVVIVDDEADAASLNTLVNKNRISTINGHLNAIKDLSTSSLYLQVTATPQSVLLQSNISGWKPAFIYYFKPGKDYIGGEFIYSQPKPYCIEFTREDELDTVKIGDSYIPDGLKRALLSYLIVSAHFRIQGESTCNFLVHPSVKIADHLSFSTMLGEHLNELLYAITEESGELVKPDLEEVWKGLKGTKPDVESFEDIFDNIIHLVEQQLIRVLVLNSTSSFDVSYQSGFNIIVGGNSLGRGVTIPKLQIVYYCRKSKTPQADTFWQHARMFGYDRDKGLLRIFLPPSLYSLFAELNVANKLLINQIISEDISSIQLIYRKDISPTRKNVVDKKALNLIIGGVNFFASNPRQDNVDIIDQLVDGYAQKEHYHTVSSDILVELLKYLGDENQLDWNNERYIDSIRTLATKRPSTKFALIIRKDRDISKGTGTLLSPTDRRIGDSLKDRVVLTIYRVVGGEDKGWEGHPFYIPNIKLPADVCIYDTIEL